MAVRLEDGLACIAQVMKLTKLVGKVGKHKRTASRMVSCPLEMMARTGTVSCFCTSRSNVTRSPPVLLRSGRASKISSDKQSRMIYNTGVPDIGL